MAMVTDHKQKKLETLVTSGLKVTLKGLSGGQVLWTAAEYQRWSRDSRELLAEISSDLFEADFLQTDLSVVPFLQSYLEYGLAIRIRNRSSHFQQRGEVRRRLEDVHLEFIRTFREQRQIQLPAVFKIVRFVQPDLIVAEHLASVKAQALTEGIGFADPVEMHAHLKRQLELLTAKTLKTVVGDDHVTHTLDSSEQAWEKYLGNFLTQAQVREYMRLESDRELETLVEHGEILALPSKSAGRLFPVVQFGPDQNVLPGISQIIHILRKSIETPYTIASWLVSPKPYLENMTPVAWLEQERDPEIVLAGAEQSAARLAS